MTASRDPDRLIHAFLLEGEEQLHDQIYDAVRAEIDQKRQRTYIGPWRTPIMNKLVFGLGAAAVVVIGLFLGAQLLGSPTNLGGPGASTTPEPTATAESSPTTEPSASVEAGLPEGSHVLARGTENGVPITVTIAAPGWVGEPGVGYVEKGLNGADPPDGAGMIAFDEGEYYVYGDPCQWSTTRPDTPATTVDELVEAVANQGSREESAPEDITVDGYAGKKIILDMAGWEIDFDACDEGNFALFGVPGHDPARVSQGPGQTDEVWALDVDGRLVVAVGGYYAETPPDHVAEVRAILGSMTFGE